MSDQLPPEWQEAERYVAAEIERRGLPDRRPLSIEEMKTELTEILAGAPPHLSEICAEIAEHWDLQ